MEEKRKRRLRRVALAVVSLLFVTLVGGVVGLRLYYNDTRLLALVRELVAKNVPFPVHIGDVQLRLQHGIVVREVVVGPPNAAYHDDVFSVSEVRLGYRLAPLLHKRLVVSDIEVVAPHATLEMQNGKWNVVALGEAFPAAASQPAAPPPAASSSDLPLAIDAEKIAMTDATADVDSADLSAHLEHVSLLASAALAGKEGHGKVKVNVGTAAAPCRLTFRQQGLGEAKAALVTEIDVDAASLNNAKVSLTLALDGLAGKMAGFALPTVPITMTFHAEADLLQQLAHLNDFSLALGDALKVNAKAEVAQMLSDNPALTLSALTIKGDVAPLLALAPKGLVPVAAHGGLEITVSAGGKKNAFLSRYGFTAHTQVQWHRVHAVTRAATVNDTNGTLQVDIGAADDPIAVKLTGDVQAAEVPAAKVNGIKWDITTHAPWSLLANVLDTSLKSTISLTVERVEAAGQSAEDTQLALAAELFDLTGAHARAQLKVQTLANLAGSSVPRIPIHLELAAERQAPRAKIESLTISVGEALSASVKAKVEQKAGGALGVFTDVKIEKADLAALWNVLPAAQRPPDTTISGEMAGEVMTAGLIDKTLQARLTGTPLELLKRGSPLLVDIELAWKNIAVQVPAATVTGMNGSLIGSLGHEVARMKLVNDADVSAAGTDLHGLHIDLQLQDKAGKVGVDFATKVASLHKPDVLAMDLVDTSVAARVKLAREIELEAFDIDVPTLGAHVNAGARLLQAEKFVREEQWKDLRGVVAETHARLSLKTPTLKPLAASPLAVSGEIAATFGGKLEEGLLQLSGGLEAKDFSADTGSAVLSHMSGTLPFAQDLKLAHGTATPIWSSDDIFKSKPRLSYYEELRSYGRDAAGLSIEHLQSGRIALDKVSLDGRWAQGIFAIDHFGAHVLDGDASGELAVQLGADKTFRLSMQAVFANIDLSVLSKTEPGPDSQINGNLGLSLGWGERIHDLNGTFNLTRLGRKMLAKALQALDPQDKDPKMRKNRELLERYQISIDLLEATLRNNALAAHLYYGLLLTKLTLGLYKPIDPKLWGKPIDLSPFFDIYLGPLMKPLGPLLGWRPPAAEKGNP